MKANYGLSTGFMSEQSIQQMYLDIENEINKNPSLSEEKVFHIKYVYYLMQYIFKDRKSVSVTNTIGSVSRRSGCVTIEGKNIVFTNALMFAKAAKLASNVEVYPKLDGYIIINFTFNRLAVKYE